MKKLFFAAAALILGLNSPLRAEHPQDSEVLDQFEEKGRDLGKAIQRLKSSRRHHKAVRAYSPELRAGLGTAAELPSPLTLEGLLKLDQLALDTIYWDSEAGELPRGIVRGKAVVVPGTIVPAQMLLFSFWQGKEFSDDGKTLYNRVFGVNRFQGETYLGTSWLDSKPSWYIDYRQTAPIIYQIHDEYRQVAPGLWLGRTYLRGENPPLVLNFVIESIPQPSAPTDSETFSKEREEKLQATMRDMDNAVQAP